MLLFQDFGSWGLLVLRLFLGAVFIYHSLPKLSNPTHMARGMGKSTGFVAVLGFFEFVAGLALILGFYVEIAAIVTGIVMLGAMYYKMFKWNVSFFSMTTTGWEYDFILLGASVAILLLGAGSISLDSLLGIWP